MTGIGPSRFVTAFLAADSPMLLLDADLTVGVANRAAAAFTGYDRDCLEELTLSDLAASDVDDISARLSKAQSWSGTLDVETRSGRLVRGHGSVSPIPGEEGFWYVAVFVDATFQRRLEDATEVMNRLLRHDLRNDLNLVIGYVQQAQARIDDEEAIDRLDRTLSVIDDVVNKCKRARDLRELLDRSGGSADHLIDLAELLERELLAAMREHEGAEFRYGGFPNVEVRADPLLDRAVGAVLDNAVVHNDRETPVVEVGVEEDDERVRVRITDNGPGVPDRHKEVVFGREEVSPLHHGSGISLFFADCVVGSGDGRIWIEDNDPRGAVFVLELRRA